MQKLRDMLGKRWFANAVAGCIVVGVYLLLSYFPQVWAGIGRFIGYFSPLPGGCVIAFLMNPLAKLYARTVFCKVRREGTRWGLSIFLTILTVLILLSLILLSLVPQLVESGTAFVNNLSSYAVSLQSWLQGLGVNVEDSALDLQGLIDSSENLLETIVDLISVNANRIVSVSTSAGKGVFNWVIAFILSVYLLAEKQKLMTGGVRLLRAVFRSEHCDAVLAFLRRCNEILNRYVIFNLIDCLIVFAANALFMSVTGMQYMGLVSFIAAIFNLVPTFGPFIGGAFGGFVLLMVKPIHALMFVGFTLVLQLCDGYVLKPRLFGNSLGVSGLWILVAVIAGGRMLGVAGILLAIPLAAIMDHLYIHGILPMLERRRARKNTEGPLSEPVPAAQTRSEGEEAPPNRIQS